MLTLSSLSDQNANYSYHSRTPVWPYHPSNFQFTVDEAREHRYPGLCWKATIMLLGGKDHGKRFSSNVYLLLINRYLPRAGCRFRKFSHRIMADEGVRKWFSAKKRYYIQKATFRRWLGWEDQVPRGERRQRSTLRNQAAFEICLHPACGHNLTSLLDCKIPWEESIMRKNTI